jgi:hypothetical protein
MGDLAAELVGLRVDAIVLSTTPAALAAKKTTETIPIIFPTAFDLVGVALAKSRPRPGGNVTGFTLLVREVSAKGWRCSRKPSPVSEGWLSSGMGPTPRTRLYGRKWRPPPGLPDWRLTLDKSGSRETSKPPSRQSCGSNLRGSLFWPTRYFRACDWTAAPGALRHDRARLKNSAPAGVHRNSKLIIDAAHTRRANR